MAPPPANSNATDGNSQPKIGKQDPSSTSNQDLGQGFNKSHSSIYAMGHVNPDSTHCASTTTTGGARRGDPAVASRPAPAALL